MHNARLFLLFLSFTLILGCTSSKDSSPKNESKNELKPSPFESTGFLESELITSNDVTTLDSITLVGKETRITYDRRTDLDAENEVIIFDVSFSDNLQIEFQVNPEFSTDNAEFLVSKYARVIGQLPFVLREGIETVMIHDGLNPFGGGEVDGKQNILIHKQQGDAYEQNGFLEEILFHEATHTSLDPMGEDESIANTWIEAQTNDNCFISNYAEDFPDREDLAESFLIFLAIKLYPSRFSDQSIISSAQSCMPNRINVFESFDFSFYPMPEAP